MDEIIPMFFREKDWRLTDNVREELSSVSKGNLWILSYALKSLESKQGRQLDRDLVLKEVEKDLSALYEENPLFPRLLTALSILYRYEIPTDTRYLNDRFEKVKGDPETALITLVGKGEVVFVPTEQMDEKEPIALITRY